MIGTKKLAVVLFLVAGIFSLAYKFFFHQQDIITQNNFDELDFGKFVEEDFPYITVSLDARNLGKNFPDDNVTARCVAIQLGNNSYACFDTDLLRWSVFWTGDFLPMVLPAQVSYNEFFKKNNNELPYVLGEPKIATSIYPGWSIGQPNFDEIRPDSQKTVGLYWGPIPPEYGRWNGTYVFENSVILSYSINKVDVIEMPGSVTFNDQTAFTRTIRMNKNRERLYVNVAEVINGTEVELKENRAHIYEGGDRDSVTIVAVKGRDGLVKVIDDQYITVEMPKSNIEREFTIVSWKGASEDSGQFDHLVKNCDKAIPDFENGSPEKWDNEIFTKGVLSSDTSAFVTDLLTLPVPNPWNRNVRVADINFFSDGKAAVSTYEGDVWTVEGISSNLELLKWKRYASGLFEPMSIEVVNEQIYVYGREGIIKLNDLNGDGEADYYENFSNLMQQSTGTREWASDMVVDANGNFYVSKGGHITGYKGVLPYLTNTKKERKWRASTNHSGSIIKIDPTGRKIDVVATGLRMPYLGINRNSGFITASDQQGNFVPATPIYPVEHGNYFGVPLTRHGMDSVVSDPITWIPHSVDRSAAGQVWIESNKMDPLNNQMLHISYGLPGLFKVLLDTTTAGLQGGVMRIKANYPSPILKGEINPKDGQLYLAGFNNYASNSKGISALLRLRYTGRQGFILDRFEAGIQGILLYFDFPLDKEALQKKNFVVKRWNYERTEEYGSGHFKVNGDPGEESLPVLGAYLSADNKKVFILIPDMKPVDQMKVRYKVVSKEGKQLEDSFWFTVHQLDELEIEALGFPDIDFERYNLDSINFEKLEKADQPISAERGKELFTKSGCIGCHSVRNDTDGLYGPPFQGIYGTERELTDGRVVQVDDSYIRESIVNPGESVVKGYSPEMPSFEGILSESDIESIILYIESL